MGGTNSVLGAGPNGKSKSTSGKNFEKGQNLKRETIRPLENEMELSTKLRQKMLEKLPDTTITLLTEALSELYHVHKSNIAGDTLMNLNSLINAMEKEELAPNTQIVEEGTAGDKLYVVESGEFDVSIKGKHVRKIGPGSIFGELALFYREHRTASVRNTSTAVIWSLHRDVFKAAQTAVAIAADSLRIDWLKNCPELKNFTQLDFARLVHVLKVHHFLSGEMLFMEGKASERVYLIEKGSAVIYMKHETFESLSDGQKEGTSLDDVLGVSRPTGEAKQASFSINANQIENATNCDAEGLELLKASPETSKKSNSVVELEVQEHPIWGRMVGRIDAGCMIGLQVLRSKLNLPNATWVWEDGFRNLSKSGKFVTVTPGGALPAITVIASEELQCSSFDVNRFEKLFVCKQAERFVHNSSSTGVKRTLSTDVRHRKASEKIFEFEKFELKGILGKGALGTIVLAEYNEDKDTTGATTSLQPPPPKELIPSSPSTATVKGFFRSISSVNSHGATTNSNEGSTSPGGAANQALNKNPSLRVMDRSQGSFMRLTSNNISGRPLALKIMNKAKVLDAGQVRHVLDERRFLSGMNDKRIVRLYGVCQTPQQLVLVTEYLPCGDLFRLLYDTPEVINNSTGGLPLSLVQFYTAGLLMGLAHMHERGVAYRDLKPENVMFDEFGYIRIIDFGFAKSIPYSKTVKGEVQIMVKTYTFCGTPAYLAPEIIFNLGHNHMVDLWALGVLMHEMLVAATPFESTTDPNDMSALFAHIAASKNYLKLSEIITSKASYATAVSFLRILLSFDPNDRTCGVQCTTRALLDSEFFADIDLINIDDRSYIPEYSPEPQEPDPITTLAVRPFNGDQNMFADF